MDAQVDRVTSSLYARLEERVMARDQIGASQVYYDLVRAGRPLKEIVAEGVRIHAPYTHVPYHERIDDGYPNFVNNDHCLLSARATINLAKMVPERLAMLPMAQTIWYIPSGLDIWNQKMDKAPGHYTRARGNLGAVEKPPEPVVYWPDQEPLCQEGPLKDRLSAWMTLVHRGQVLDAYRTFLGLMEDVPNRKAVLAELVFAGLIDVQDRMLFNRSYTTGHKAYRARSTVEIGNAIGWDDPSAHHVLYAGALDMAVGPRWYSTYEMACNLVKMNIEGEALHAVPYGGVSDAELAVLRDNKAALNQEEAAGLIDAVIRSQEPDNLHYVTRLLKAGKDPRRILDVMQIACAQVVMETTGPNNFSMPHHCYEYCNTLAWFYDNFDHPRRLRLIYLLASFLNHVAEHQRGIGDSNPVVVDTTERCGQADRRAVARPCRQCGVRAERGGEPGVDAGVSRQRRRPRAAGGAYRAGRDQAGQRSAQPGDRPVHADGFRYQPSSGTRQAAAVGGVPHGDAPQVRRSSGAGAALRRGDGSRAAIARSA